MRAKILLSILCGLPLVLLAFTNTPLVRRAGVPTDDNGATCTACHQSQNGSGRVTLDIATYVPGESQTIQVAITDPNASRWGFQLTARPLNDTTQEAGTFAPITPGAVMVRCDDGTSTGSAPPCNGLREFAQHVNAPNMTGGAYTFAVRWTAPIQEVGKIAFYVAAVAANGDSTTAGDNTYAAMQVVTLSGEEASIPAFPARLTSGRKNLCNTCY